MESPDVVCILHFLYSMLSHIAKRNYAMIGADDVTQFWIELFKLMKKVSQVKSNSVRLWQVEVMRLAIVRMHIADSLSNVTIRKRAKEMLDTLIKKLNKISLNGGKVIRWPLPPAVFDATED